MILRKTYFISDWGLWDRTINEAVREFKLLTGVNPNILLANEETHALLDLAATHLGLENIYRETGQEQVRPQIEEAILLGGFEGPDYRLEFCVDQALGRDVFSLIFDDNPEGGEPVPEADNALEYSMSLAQRGYRKVS
jgi:hypothetical protein